jgi:hypothetical protein
MEGERVVFTEESDPQRYVKLIASGELDESLLDGLSDYVKRQRKRLGLPEGSQRPTNSPIHFGPSAVTRASPRTRSATSKKAASSGKTQRRVRLGLGA